MNSDLEATLHRSAPIRSAVPNTPEARAYYSVYLRVLSPGAWTALLTKAVATALIVTLASALAEAAGPIWGALAASLPVSAGPTYIFLALQHDRRFVAASALSSFAANTATMAFLTVYARRAAASARALGAATAVWFVSALLIQRVAWTAGSAVLLNLVAFGVGLRVLRDVSTATAETGPAVSRRWFDLPLRAVAVALFVVSLVLASAALGPAATGTAASFPIVFTVVFLVLHGRMGGAARALLAATALRAMGGFGLMLLVVHLAVLPWGAPVALSLALLTTLAWSAGLLLLRASRRRGGVGRASRRRTRRCSCRVCRDTPARPSAPSRLGIVTRSQPAA